MLGHRGFFEPASLSAMLTRVATQSGWRGDAPVGYLFWRVASSSRSAGLALACVTGTNGKTTTTTMLEAIAAAAGDVTARITTLGAWVAGTEILGGADGQLERTFAAAREAGVQTFVLETTSYALSHGLMRHVPPPSAAVFTNLTRDHLDYHGTPEHYLASKAQLFIGLSPDGAAVLNAGDPASALLSEVTAPGARRLGYTARAVDPDCSAIPLALAASRVSVGRDGTRLELAASPLADRLGGAIELCVVGEVHSENALAAAVAADALGFPADAIRAALSTFRGVPGRFEVVASQALRGAALASAPGEPTVVVDYAHTPDALERTLLLARALVAPHGGRVICVFGCGGDRDPGKRGEMGRVASRLADAAVVTTDNPRTEDPEAIADAILKGMEGRSSHALRMGDRARAIRRAVGDARAADIVVIAGKGHEKTQIYGDRVIPFDDVEVARSALSRARGLRPSRKNRRT
jgi:UDP-N-acetylmuramoyl-L-alanyl-D-glutamate--2,6-diaminopimelate ligase